MGRSWTEAIVSAPTGPGGLLQWREVLAVPFDQQVLLEFAHGVSRELLHEVDLSGALVAGELFFAAGNQVALGNGVSGHVKHHDGHHPLAVIVIAQADHSRLPDLGKAFEHVLDFLGVDVEASSKASS